MAGSAVPIGAAPALVVGKPRLLSTTKFLRRVEGIVDSHVLTNNGPYVRALEEAVGHYVGAECVAVSNATVAFCLVARALRLREIHAPSYTFVAATHSLEAADVEVRFLDVMPDTPHIDLERVGHLPVCAANLYGSACQGYPDAEPETDVGKRVPLIFDSAHALGVSRRAPLGSRGTCDIFSMHATKFIAAGEGGLITTRDSSLAAALRDMRNFGFDYRSTQPDGDIKGWGTNAKMSEFHAALGLTNFEDMETFREINEQNYRVYAQYLPEGVTLFDPGRGGFRSNYCYVVVTVAPDIRDDLVRALYVNGVCARRYFHPHVARLYGLDSRLPHSDTWSDSVICLPTGPTISTADVGRICRILELSGRDARRGRELAASHQ